MAPDLLTCSARDWCEMIGKDLSDYLPRPFESVDLYINEHKREFDYIRNRRCTSLKDVEVIVDLRKVMNSYKGFECRWIEVVTYGTALIPKHRKKRGKK